MLLSYLRNHQIYFVEGIINEDLIFGFECVLNAQKICFFNGRVFYRIREGSTSNPKTFNQHKLDLLFRSYFTNFKYLLPLYTEEKYKNIRILLRNCLIMNAQIPVLCWIKNKNFCQKEDLKPLIPFMKFKTKMAYYFSNLARFLLVKKRNYE